MDPNANLHELRTIALRVLNSETNTPESILDDAEQMAELFSALNTWIMNGGALPKAWQEVQR